MHAAALQRQCEGVGREREVTRGGLKDSHTALIEYIGQSFVPAAGSQRRGGLAERPPSRLLFPSYGTREDNERLGRAPP